MAGQIEWQQELLKTLTFKVQLLSLSQIARVWFPDLANQRSRVKSKLEKLQDEGLLESHLVHASPLLPLEKPVFEWRPGDTFSSSHDISEQLRSRWKVASFHEQELARVYCASQKTVNMFGGNGVPFVPLGHETHDLHLAQLYLNLRSKNPDLADRWIGEEVYREQRRGKKLPDAMILDATGNPERVIEFGGAYDAHHVRAFHMGCKSRRLPYELW